ncbi:MAG: TIGR02996 domain-containing protein [Deltaproteobacteria bacterium]|nr:TIGR02996 domain-containing protein [Deltaproteobacteria bacterium]
MTDPLATLRAAILENPADDELRLVYADRLIELGEPRGALISAQLANTRGDEAARLARLTQARLLAVPLVFGQLCELSLVRCIPVDRLDQEHVPRVRNREGRFLVVKHHERRPTDLGDADEAVRPRWLFAVPRLEYARRREHRHIAAYAFGHRDHITTPGRVQARRRESYRSIV